MNQLPIEDNEFSALPESLSYLDASGNRLTALPANLPAGLESLIVEFNRIREEDLDRAAKSIQEAEQREFLDDPATDWNRGSRWCSVCAGPPTSKPTVNTLVNKLAGNEFEKLLSERLAHSGLQHDSDAQVHAGSQPSLEVAHEIKRKLTLEFLSSRDLSDLLGKP